VQWHWTRASRRPIAPERAAYRPYLGRQPMAVICRVQSKADQQDASPTPTEIRPLAARYTVPPGTIVAGPK
jgi:hypothetical protein